MNIEKIASAIEADAGESLPELRQALEEAKARVGRVTTPEQMLVSQAPDWPCQATGRKPKDGLRKTSLPLYWKPPR